MTNSNAKETDRQAETLLPKTVNLGCPMLSLLVQPTHTAPNDPMIIAIAIVFAVENIKLGVQSCLAIERVCDVQPVD